ncbi:hypothetical protein [Mesorhizobium sp. SARCC-RB16n]
MEQAFNRMAAAVAHATGKHFTYTDGVSDHVFGLFALISKRVELPIFEIA